MLPDFFIDRQDSSCSSSTYVISQARDRASSWQPSEGYNVMLNIRVCHNIVFTFLASKKGLDRGSRDLLDPEALNTTLFQRSFQNCRVVSD